MTAAEARKLKWGTRVIMTKAARRNNLPYYKSGIFLGVTQHPNQISVVPEGLRTISIFWCGFWKVAE